MNKKRVAEFSRQEIYDFVTTYCYSPLFDNLEECANHYDLSIYMAKELIYRAIGECIVEDDAVDILTEKSYRSAYQHAIKEGIYSAPHASQKKYQQLKEMRKSFYFSDDYSVKVTLQYLLSPLPKAEFCEENFLAKCLFDRTFKKVIIQGAVSDEIVEELYQKSLRFHFDSDPVDKFFEKLRKARKKYQEEQHS